METTDRTHMYEFLCDLQGLQREAFTAGLNFETNIRDANKESPWLTVLVYAEPFEKDGCRQYFYFYNHRSVDDNREILEEIRAFIDEHRQL